MEVSQDTILRGPAVARRDAGFGAASAWEPSRSDSPGTSHARGASFAANQNSRTIEQRAMVSFAADEWDRLPWLPDEPEARREEFDLALVLWVFVATFLIA